MASNVANAACLAVPRAVHLRRSYHLRTDAHCTTAFLEHPSAFRSLLFLDSPRYSSAAPFVVKPRATSRESPETASFSFSQIAHTCLSSPSHGSCS
jgi:hypothetical protein